MVSCQLEEEKEEARILETQKTLKPTEVKELENVPFATKSTLDRINKDPNMIKWEAIRMLAYYELQTEHTHKEGWKNVTLSKRPVIIYGTDSSPKYYEFIVQDETGKGVGVLTLNATKDSPNIVPFVSDVMKDYTPFTTKGEGYKIIANEYPNVALGILGKSGEEPSAVVDPESGEITQLIPEIKTPQDAREFYLKSLSPEELAEMGGIDKITNQIQAKYQEEKDAAFKLWTLIEEAQDTISQVKEETVLAKANATKRLPPENYCRYVTGSSTVYKYDSRAHYYPELLNMKWRGACGPSALSWIYASLYDSYNGHNIRQAIRNSQRGDIHYFQDKKTEERDKNIDPTGLWNRAMDLTDAEKGYYGINGATSVGRMRTSLEQLTGGKFSTAEWEIMARHTYHHVRDKGLPSLILTKSNGEAHYTVAIESDRSCTDYWFFTWCNYKFRVADNGSVNNKDKSNTRWRSPYWYDLYYRVIQKIPNARTRYYRYYRCTARAARPWKFW